MKAIVMGGGMGTRLRPMTDPLNKHTLPIFDRPLIHHVIETLVAGGVTEVMVLLNWKHPGILMEQLGNGSHFGCDISFKYTNEPKGVGQHLLLAERWVNGEDFVFMLGDSMFFTPLHFTSVTAPHLFAMLLSDDDDPRKYGHVTFDADGVVEHLVEKPAEPVSSWIQTGVWVFPADVFDLVRETPPQESGEIPIGTVVPHYVRQRRLTCSKLPPHSYLDCGTREAFYEATRRIAEQRPQ